MAESLESVLNSRGFLANHQVIGPDECWTRSVLWDANVALLQADLFGSGAYSRLVEELRVGGVFMVAMAPTVDASTFERCLNGGASTVLSMDSPLGVFVDTIDSVLSNSTMVEEKAREQLAVLRERESRASARRLSPFGLLTARESEVLAEIVKGRTAEAIANDSWVAVSTVRSQIKSILQKLGVNSQVAAVALARENGWSSSKNRRKSPAAPRGRGQPGVVVAPRLRDGRGYDESKLA
jgi:two-component system, NarL family, nitrate/nitrite response regulator NarL